MKGSRADRQTIRENIRRIAAIYSLPLLPPTIQPPAFLLAIQKQARKPRSYASLKLRPTYLLARVKSRATSVAKKTVPEAQRTHDYNLNNFPDRNQFEGSVTCIGSKFCHQVALVVNLASRWRYLHCL